MACCLLPQERFGITILTLTATTCQGIVRRQASTSQGKPSETHAVASYRRMDSVFGSIKVRSSLKSSQALTDFATLACCAMFKAVVSR